VYSELLSVYLPQWWTYS